jgi:hypothetical protein
MGKMSFYTVVVICLLISIVTFSSVMEDSKEDSLGDAEYNFSLNEDSIENFSDVNSNERGDIENYDPSLVFRDWRESVPVTGVKAIVLFVHWGNEEPGISNRNQIESSMEDAINRLEEYSFGMMLLDYDICERSTSSNLPEDPREAAQMAVDLCDRAPSTSYPMISGSSPYRYHKSPLSFQKNSLFPVGRLTSGVDYSNYDWIIVFPVEADWEGFSFGDEAFTTRLGAINKKLITIKSLSFPESLIVHEGGHTLGLRHANNIVCDSETQAVSGSCLSEEYGDNYDRMGSGTASRHFNCAYKEELGWLRSPENIIQTSGGTYWIDDYEEYSMQPQCLRLSISPSDVTADFEMERDDREVENPCEILYVEYRRAKSGVFLHCFSSEQGGYSFLIDCLPDPSDTRVYLREGETCRTGLGFNVGFIEKDGDRARVSVVDAGGGFLETLSPMTSDSEYSFIGKRFMKRVPQPLPTPIPTFGLIQNGRFPLQKRSMKRHISRSLK